MSIPATTLSAPPRRNRTWKGPRELPATLPDAPCYVLWRYGSEPNGKGKYPKIPFSPHKGDDGKYHKADTQDSATWGTFAECMTAAADWRGWFDGVGKILLDGEVGTDGDTTSAESDQLISSARGRAYIERSVSGEGWHIIALGEIADAIKTDAIEIYPGGTGRYFALGDELEGSTCPGQAQDVIDRAIELSGTQPRERRAPTTLRMAETVAMTPELTADVRAAQSELADLLRELPSNLTPQLADLLYRGIFPPAVKDTSASGARAVVVAQLHRAPKRRYTDAQIYILARELWRRKAYEGAMKGKDTRLDADAWRLIALYRPGAPPKATPDKRTYHEAPDPLVYLARLADDADGDAVLLNRDERAALAGVTRATAQRTEEKLVKSDLIELKTYALHGGLRGRRGAIHITPAGFAALRSLNESVIISAPVQDDLVKNTAAARHKPRSTPDNTLFGDRSPAARPQQQPRVPPAVVLPPTPVEKPDEWEGIEDEITAWEQTSEGRRCLRWRARQERGAVRAEPLPLPTGYRIKPPGRLLHRWRLVSPDGKVSWHATEARARWAALGKGMQGFGAPSDGPSLKGGP